MSLTQPSMFVIVEKMATTEVENRRNQVMVGELPPDFLRVSNTAEQQIAADHQTAAILQAQMPGGVSAFSQSASRLSVTLVQANLVKNYGLTKMDPYCRVRVGHSVFETHTATNGGRNPAWNKVIHVSIPAGVESIYLEIFDERSFTIDDRVAWAHIPIPERVFKGETVEDWFPLSGKQGEQKEGSINLVLSYSKVMAAPVQRLVYTVPGTQAYGMPGQQVLMMPQQPGLPYYGYQPAPMGTMPMPMPMMQQPHPPQHSMQPPQQQVPVITEQDVAAIKDMFPNLDEDVVRSVLEVNRGNKDATVNQLLSM